jgi:peroxiredoxin
MSDFVSSTRLVAGRIGVTMLALYLFGVAVRIGGCYGPEPYPRDQRPGAGPAVGEAFPAFTMEDVSGATISLGDLAGAPAALVFVPSLDWSAPTKARVGDLAELVRDRREGRIAVIMTAAQATPRARTFVRDHATPFYYLQDADGLVTRLGLASPAPDGTPASLPATFVLDGTGVVHLRDVRVGPERWLDPAVILDALGRVR